VNHVITASLARLLGVIRPRRASRLHLHFCPSEFIKYIPSLSFTSLHFAPIMYSRLPSVYRALLLHFRPPNTKLGLNEQTIIAKISIIFILVFRILLCVHIDIYIGSVDTIDCSSINKRLGYAYRYNNRFINDCHATCFGPMTMFRGILFMKFKSYNICNLLSLF
jgi:hypothetical protein